jgi:hypothetical protein
MSDPQRPPGKTPRRAEPLQPDRPGRGTDRLNGDEDATSGRASAPTRSGKESTERLIEQENTALDNVRHP